MKTQYRHLFFAGLTLLAFAPGLSAQSTESDDHLIHTTKTVEQITEGTDAGKYKVTLESWTTGDQSIRPNDIVLVLDVSGSMREIKTPASTSYIATEKDSWSYNDIENSIETYYYKVNNNYYAVNSYVDRHWTGGMFNGHWVIDGYYLTYRTGSGWGASTTYIGPVTDPDAELFSGVLYRRVTTGGKTKLEELQDAVETFITQIKEKEDALHLPEGKGSRIAIVKYAGVESSSYTTVNYYDNNASAVTESGSGSNKGNHTSNTTDQDGYRINYNEVVRGLKFVATDSEDLISAVNNLSAAGATASDRGMHLASNIMASSNVNRNSNRVVILFTDGEPNHSTGFSDSVASSAIGTAKELKDDGVVVFTIGVFNTANLSDPAKTDKYMEYTSSDYPSAESMENAGSGGEDDKGFYIEVGPDMNISDAFEQAAEQVNSTLNAEAIVKDNMTNSFKLPDGASTNDNDIHVYTVDWVSPGEWKTNSNGEVRDEITDDPEISIIVHQKGVVEEEGKPAPEHDGIEVSGFSYIDHWVGTRRDINTGAETVSGKKLVIEFIIAIDGEVSAGGPAVATNMPDSGIYENADADEPILAFEVPRVKIPVNIHIQKYGLAQGHSATFLVERVRAKVVDGEVYIDPTTKQPVPVDGATYSEYMTVLIKKTGTSDPADRWIRGLDPDYLYRVSEDNWSWTYTISGQVYETAAQPDNPFGFTNNPSTDNPPKNAESTVKNDLKYTSTTTTTTEEGTGN